MTRSPSFSRSASSTTMTMRPRRKSASAASMESNSGFIVGGMYARAGGLQMCNPPRMPAKDVKVGASRALHSATILLRWCVRNSPMKPLFAALGILALASFTLVAATPDAKSATAERLATIIKEMKSPDREVRLKAVGQLVHFAGGQEQALPAFSALREAMRDPEADIRAVVCTAMGNFHEQAKPAIPDLTRLLRDPDKEVRQCAVRALGRVGADAKVALPDMARSTKDEDAVVRVVAHAAMIRVGASADEHLPAILKGLGDASPLVRYKSAHCLEPLGAVAAPGVAKLGALLTDPDEKVRHYSARALVNLGETARPALAALKAARELEKEPGNRGLMDAAIRKLTP
ncbi:MAG: HEAT repeat domain-containing protein [Proteobacteria bacterium]|nr:HEAT repeat domain-containing protein [Verrucomicrobiota bacterium]NBU08005.1 HEAT repeat domain-containing protein [Pseudomonadota bacterium]